MVYHMKGNLLDAADGHIIIPTNTKGVMGAGLARQFKEKFHELYKVYKDLCYTYKPKGGDIFTIITPNLEIDSITFVMTKDHYNQPSNYEYIEEALEQLNNASIPMDRVIHIPCLGCGLGGLDKVIVKAMIEKRLTNYKTIFLYS